MLGSGGCSTDKDRHSRHRRAMIALSELGSVIEVSGIPRAENTLSLRTSYDFKIRGG